MTDAIILDKPPTGIPEIEDCDFYHTMDIPGIGTVNGAWDLRGHEATYLGNFDFSGKRVLEVGTASGMLCFYMEKQGAEVIAYDLSPEYKLDTVPFYHLTKETYDEGKKHIRRLNNSFRLAYNAHKSSSKLVYGSAYDIPEAIGPVDVTTFCSILLHIRDPFLALAKGSKLAKDSIIIVEPYGKLSYIRRAFGALKSLLPEIPLLSAPYVRFAPCHKRKGPIETWWHFTPEVLCKMLGVLGFHNTEVTFHDQLFHGRKVKLFTIVAKRTHEVPYLDFI